MKKILALMLLGVAFMLSLKGGSVLSHWFPEQVTKGPPAGVLQSTPDPLFVEFQHRYLTPQEVIQGLVNDYGFQYDYQYRTDYREILNGDNSLANILRHKKGVCQQFATLSAAGLENKGYDLGIMVLLSKVASSAPSDADHEIMAFKDRDGLWGYISNEKYIAPAYRDLDEIFYTDWSDRYRGYRYWDVAGFPPNWEANEDLAFAAAPLVGPVSPYPGSGARETSVPGPAAQALAR